MSKFVRRFFKDPYRKEDSVWIRNMAKERGIRIKDKLEKLKNLL